MKKRATIPIRGSLPRVAKYLLTNEEKIFMIFDYEHRNPIESCKKGEPIEYDKSEAL